MSSGEKKKIKPRDKKYQLKKLCEKNYTIACTQIDAHKSML